VKQQRPYQLWQNQNINDEKAFHVHMQHNTLYAITPRHIARRNGIKSSSLHVPKISHYHHHHYFAKK